MRNDIYLAEVVKVDVESDFQVGGIEWGYDESKDEDEYDDEYDDEYACEYDFVVATPVPDIPSALDAVNKLHNLAISVGLKSIKLLGAEATVANYKKYLKCGLKGFVNVGHGNPNGIALTDGTLSASWFNSIANRNLKPGVVYFNSCQVHNDPLKSAVMKAGARTFIGGIVNLLIGASEEVCKCFWEKVLKSPVHMKDALHQCEKEKYPNEGAHGIIGDTGSFAFENLKLAHAMWTHGHSMQIEYPERLAAQKRMGFYMQVKGKPFTSNWFHFAIPTPVIVDNKRLRVGSVMIRFRTGPGAIVNAIHIYDGETKIATHDNLNLSSQGRFIWPRFDVPTLPDIRWGLGISVGVQFGDSANLPPNKLSFEVSAAGCDFVVNV